MDDKTQLLNDAERNAEQIISSGDETAEVRTAPTTTTNTKLSINLSKMVYLVLPLIGLVLVVTMSSLAGSDYYNRPWYVIGIFLGLYIIAQSCVHLTLMISGGDIELKLKGKTWNVSLSVFWMSFAMKMLFCLVMLVTFSAMPPYWFTAGHIVGIILALILLFSAFVQLMSITPQLPEDFGASLQVQVSAVNRLFWNCFPAFCDADAAVAVMKEKRMVNFLLLVVCQCLSVLAVVIVFFIRDWDSYSHHENHAEYWISGGLGWAIRCSLKYYTSISCGALLILSSIMMIGIFKASWYSNIVISLLSIGSGIYFALLSTHSLQSYMLLKTLTDMDMVYRFMQLMPIPIIAVCLLSFGISTALVNFRLEELSGGLLKRVLKSFFCLLVTILATASLVLTQISSQFIVQKHWNKSNTYQYEPQYNNDVKLDWSIKDPATLYLFSETLLATVLAIIMLVNMHTGKRLVPGLISWIMCLLMLALAIFAAFGIYGQRILDEDLWWVTKVVNTSTFGVSALLGFVGLFIYGIYPLNCLVLLFRSKVAVAGMVDNFEKQYKALAIPYPGDQGRLAEVNAQAVEQKAAFTQFIAESNSRIGGFQAELAKWEAMMPVEEMTKEEALDAGLTQFVIDPQNPTMFPHDETWEEFVEKLNNADPNAGH